MFGYSVILADPPWHFRNFSAKGEVKNPLAHYQCMSLDDIKALPVSQLAAPDCALIMWATAPLLPQAIETMAAWAFGTGYVYRSAAEFYLVGTIGKPKGQSRSIRNLIVAPVREHSRKPDQMHADIEALFEGPRRELFGRESREGWDVWGNQSTKFDGDCA